LIDAKLASLQIINIQLDFNIAVVLMHSLSDADETLERMYFKHVAKLY